MEVCLYQNKGSLPLLDCNEITSISSTQLITSIPRQGRKVDDATFLEESDSPGKIQQRHGSRILKEEGFF